MVVARFERDVEGRARNGLGVAAPLSIAERLDLSVRLAAAVVVALTEDATARAHDHRAHRRIRRDVADTARGQFTGAGKRDVIDGGYDVTPAPSWDATPPLISTRIPLPVGTAEGRSNKARSTITLNPPSLIDGDTELDDTPR